jgi:hypothetical protein
VIWSRGVIVPRISQFFGIVISIYFRDHAPPHFHARYAEHEASITIDTLHVHEGSLPHRALGLVLEWASLHREELVANWDRAVVGDPVERIAPLE